MEIFVGGRLCLFGEHSDWSSSYALQNPDIKSGKALVVGLEQGINALVKLSDKFIFRQNKKYIKSEEDLIVEPNKKELLKLAKSKTFYSYVAAVGSFMIDKFNVGGIEIDVTKVTLPIKKGLSSSAAVCVLVAQAYNQVYNLNLSEDEVMEIAYQGELLTGSKCGKMDQLCALGKQLTEVNFEKDKFSYNKIKVKKDIFMLIVDLGGNKNTKKILDSLNSSFPFSKDSVDRKVQRGLGLNNLKIVERAVKYLSTGNVKGLGKLMSVAQKNFDDYVAIKCKSELTSPILHKVLNMKEVKDLTYGGKGVGSQGDGSCQLIAKDENSREQLKALLTKEGYECFDLTIKKQVAVEKAIIPVAGYGTRLFPYTKIINKEFTPVIDNNMLKPQISVLLESLYDCGIKKIGLIVSSNKQKQMYKKFFLRPTKYLKTLDNAIEQIAYDEKLKSIYKRLHFIKNKKVDNGFAYSISLAEKFADNDPVIMCLGDTLYKNKSLNCNSQLIEFYNKYNKSCVGLTLIPIHESKNYGTFLAKKIGNEMQAKKLYEKPSEEFAEKYLNVGENKCLGFFGNYVLNPNVFNVIKSELKTKGLKAQFTECLDIERAEFGLLGVLLKGESLDFGNVNAYQENFSKLNKG